MYYISYKNKIKLIKLFMSLLQLLLFISTTIILFSSIILKNLSWIDTTALWGLGLFLVSLWKFINTNDFKDIDNKKD